MLILLTSFANGERTGLCAIEITAVSHLPILLKRFAAAANIDIYTPDLIQIKPNYTPDLKQNRVNYTPDLKQMCYLYKKFIYHV